MSRDARQIILEPVVTEKTARAAETANVVAFKVAGDANKIEIRHAVEKLFSVKVTDVRTISVPHKLKRLGRFEGRRPGWKKAIVTLKEGESIEFFEHV
jgi:large subunit ribosomal protein L23